MQINVALKVRLTFFLSKQLNCVYYSFLHLMVDGNLWKLKPSVVLFFSVSEFKGAVNFLLSLKYGYEGNFSNIGLGVVWYLRSLNSSLDSTYNKDQCGWLIFIFLKWKCMFRNMIFFFFFFFIVYNFLYSNLEFWDLYPTKVYT
jgi:hypothetical protein